jgi:hypothetical protein
MAARGRAESVPPSGARYKPRHGGLLQAHRGAGGRCGVVRSGPVGEKFDMFINRDELAKDLVASAVAGPDRLFTQREASRMARMYANGMPAPPTDPETLAAMFASPWATLSPAPGVGIDMGARKKPKK